MAEAGVEPASSDPNFAAVSPVSFLSVYEKQRVSLPLPKDIVH